MIKTNSDKAGNREGQAERNRKRSQVRPPSDGNATATAVPSDWAKLKTGGRARNPISNNVLNPGQRDEQCEAMASSCSNGEGCVSDTARLSQLPGSDCGDLLHQLANAMTGVLMNAQVLGWKLPPYSHLKRSVRELERNAQRGGELLKQLVRRFSAEVPPSQGITMDAACGRSALTTDGGSGWQSDLQLPTDLAAGGPQSGSGGTEPGILPEPVSYLTKQCDPCPSSIFPKRDDSSER